MNISILVLVLGGLIIGALILLMVLLWKYKKMDSITLVQRRLENSNSDIVEAIPFLKITND